MRIYEYTPGFIHAKMYVSDDKTAVVGSANMDYRSLYLHFENCCSFYGGQMVQDVRHDLEECMAVSHEVTLTTRAVPRCSSACSRWCCACLRRCCKPRLPACAGPIKHKRSFCICASL